MTKRQVVKMTSWQNER